MTCKNFNK